MLTWQGSKASATSSVVNLRKRQSLRNALVEKLLSKYFPGARTTVRARPSFLSALACLSERTDSERGGEIRAIGFVHICQLSLV